MTIRVEESRNVGDYQRKGGADPEIKQRYVVTGDEGETEAELLAAFIDPTNTPYIYDGLFRADANWIGTPSYDALPVYYGEMTWKKFGGPDQNTPVKIRGSTKSQTGNVKRSLERFRTVTARDQSNNPLPIKDFGNAVEVDGDSVKGVDIPTPYHEVSMELYLPVDLWTKAYVDIVEQPGWNEKKFHLYDPFSICFKGVDYEATFGLDGTGLMHVVYWFERRKPEYVEIPGIIGPDVDPITLQAGLVLKRGCDHIWADYDVSPDPNSNGYQKRSVRQVMVDRVERTFDFKKLGIVFS